MPAPRNRFGIAFLIALITAVWLGSAGGAADYNAPEFNGVVGWLNTSKPITLKELRGKIVLLDFWTYCCINCMHILPDLKKLEDKYKNELVVIGIHSAKFDNEKDNKAIRDAIMRYGITHPVANDANFKVWNAYGAHAWPTLVLISPDGTLIGRAAGEGHYEGLDRTIAKTIADYQSKGKLDRKPLRFALEQQKEARALSFPGKVLADGDTLFISDSGHNSILVSDLSGKVRYAIGSGKKGMQDGTFASASFNHPQGLALRDGILYIADTENHLLRKADLKAQAVTTVAGTGKQGGHRDHYTGKGLKTDLNSPWDLTFAGNKLYIAMAGAHQIWWYEPATGEVATYAGSGTEGIRDGALDQAWLAQPSGITTDGTNLYVADSEVSAIRSVGLGKNATVGTIIGHGLFEFGDQDGNATTARFQHPLGILYRDGKLFVADSYNHKIKIVDPKARTAVSFLGNGKAALQDSPKPQFSEPAGLSVSGDKLFVADTNNSCIRVVDLKTKNVQTLRILKK